MTPEQNAINDPADTSLKDDLLTDKTFDPY